MDPTRSPPIGFDWGHIPPNQMPTPIPHDLMDFNTPHDIAGIHHSDTAHYADDSQIRNPPHSATPGLSRLRPTSRLSDHDTTMNDDEAVTTQQLQKATVTRRPKHADLDWDGNRQTLYELYIQDGLILTETMEIMKKSYGFDAK